MPELSRRKFLISAAGGIVAGAAVIGGGISLLQRGSDTALVNDELIRIKSFLVRA